MKALEEVGKGLIALANLLFALVIFKDAILNSNIKMLIYGLFLLIVLYMFGYKIIKKSSKGGGNA